MKTRPLNRDIAGGLVAVLVTLSSLMPQLVRAQQVHPDTVMVYVDATGAQIPFRFGINEGNKQYQLLFPPSVTTPQQQEVASDPKFNNQGYSGVPPTITVGSIFPPGPGTPSSFITADVAKNANFTVTSAQMGVMFQVTTGASNVTATFPSAVSVGDTFYFFLRKADTGTGLVLNSALSDSVGVQGHTTLYWTDGTNWYARAWFGAIDASGNITETSAGTFTIATQANHNINLSPNGTGSVTFTLPGSVAHPALAFHDGQGFYTDDPTGIRMTLNNGSGNIVVWDFSYNRLADITDGGAAIAMGQRINSYSFLDDLGPTGSGFGETAGSILHITRTGTDQVVWDGTYLNTFVPIRLETGLSTISDVSGGIQLVNGGSADFFIKLAGGAGFQLQSGGTTYIKGTQSGWYTMNGAQFLGTTTGGTAGAPAYSYFLDPASGTGELGGSILFWSRSGVLQQEMDGALIKTVTAGITYAVKSGTNALAGTVTLSSGGATISSTAIDANTAIFFSLKTSSGTPSLTQPLAAVGTGSATVTGAATDNSTYNWVALKVN